MARMLTSSEITTAWASGAGSRSEMMENHAYFDGDQPILSRNAHKKRKNGLNYHRLVPNVFRVIARRHKGFFLGRPMNLTLGKTGSEIALAEYNNVRLANALDKLDADHYLEALLSGYSVEVHSYDSVFGPVITQTPAAEWAFVKDEHDVVRYAIRRIELAKGTWFDEQLLSAKVVVWTVYSDEEIQVFSDGSANSATQPVVKSGEDALNSIGGVGFVDLPVTQAAIEGGYTGFLAQTAGSSSLLPFGPPVAHPYGRVPVFQWTGEEDFQPFFTQDFRTLQDAYNETLSMLLDDVEGDIEALLLILGMRQGELSKIQIDAEGNETGRTLMEEIKETGGISMGADADAKFIVRGLTHEKTKFTLSELRQHLYELGHAPDLSRVVGVTGQTTGIALRLQFQTMTEKSADSQHSVRKSVAERIDLLNRIWKVQNLNFTGYNIEFTTLIPVNEIERWENIQFLMPLLAAPDLLKLIQSVDDPEEAWTRKKAEIAEGIVLTIVPKPEDKEKPSNNEGEGNDGGTD